MNEEYEIKEESMKAYLRIAKALISNFEECHVDHIPKEENANVDVLSMFASSEIENYARTVCYEVFKTPITDIRLVSHISHENYWMDPIKAHLE